MFCVVQKTLQVSTLDMGNIDKCLQGRRTVFVLFNFFSNLIIGALCVVRPQGGEERKGQLVGRRCPDNIFFVLFLFFQTER